jgi:hypothetical protein
MALGKKAQKSPTEKYPIGQKNGRNKALYELSFF